MINDVLSSSRTNYVIGGTIGIGVILTLAGYFGHSDPTFGVGITLDVLGVIAAVVKINHHFKMKRVKAALEKEKETKPTAQYVPPPNRVNGKFTYQGDFNAVKPLNGTTVADQQIYPDDPSLRGTLTLGDYHRRIDVDDREL